MRVRLTSRTFSDFNVVPAEILQVNYRRSIVGKINIWENPAAINYNCQVAIFNEIAINDLLPTTKPNTKRGLHLKIDSSSQDIPSIAALRRRNLPLPPSGVVTILRSGVEERLKGNTLRSGDTHLLLLTALGDFPTEPEIVFVLRDTSGELVIKSNLTTQGDINIFDISTASLANTQKLSAQIVIHPSDTIDILSKKVLFYTLEIVDKLADEVYTIETDKITIEPSIINYFAAR